MSTAMSTAFSLKGWIDEHRHLLKPLMETFWSNESLRTCEKCNTVMQKPQPAT